MQTVKESQRNRETAFSPGFHQWPQHTLIRGHPQDKKTGDHITYPYGWVMDNIPLDDLEKAVKLVLDGKMKYAAKSNFGKK